MNVEKYRTAPTRESLLSRLKNPGDDASWQQFFDTYANLIYTTATSSGLTDAEAQDVLQETLVAVSKAMPKFKYDPAIGSFKAWLRQVTQRKILDYLNRVRKKDVASTTFHPDDGTRRTATVERVADPASLDCDAVWDKEWHQTLFAAAVEKVKHRVSPKTFQLFELRVLRDMRVSDITNTFGVNMAQVHLASHRVSKLIREEVSRLEKEVL